MYQQALALFSNCSIATDCGVQESRLFCIDFLGKLCKEFVTYNVYFKTSLYGMMYDVCKYLGIWPYHLKFKARQMSAFLFTPHH